MPQVKRFVVASVVLDRAVSPFLEFERGIDRHFFSASFPEGLRPSSLSRISLFNEIFVALRPTKAENLIVALAKLELSACASIVLWAEN
jgi:hypothetical protein